jgi:hypothetical protein
VLNVALWHALAYNLLHFGAAVVAGAAAVVGGAAAGA